jgi:hypothetical protein
MGTEQIGEGQLSPRPGGHSAAGFRAGLHLGRHLPQAHEFQLAAGEEEAIPRPQPADERLLHLAQHRTAHEAHRDRAIRGDRADVEAVQAGDRRLPHPKTQGLPGAVEALQLLITRIGPEAVTAVMKHPRFDPNILEGSNSNPLIAILVNENKDKFHFNILLHHPKTDLKKQMVNATYLVFSSKKMTKL